MLAMSSLVKAHLLPKAISGPPTPRVLLELPPPKDAAPQSELELWVLDQAASPLPEAQEDSKSLCSSLTLSPR